MSLREIVVDSKTVIEEAGQSKEQLAEYVQQCARIYDEILAVNQALGSAVAVEVPNPEGGESQLVLSAPFTEQLSKPDSWGATVHYTVFVLRRDSIFGIRVVEDSYPLQLRRLEPGARHRELIKTISSSSRSIVGSQLQIAINSSLLGGIPKGSPIDPGTLRGIEI